jgi:hypothetical protein
MGEAPQRRSAQGGPACYASASVGSLLDLAVIGLAILVTCTLLLLAWTLGVSGVHSVRRARRQALLTRLQLTIIERRLRAPDRAEENE